MYQVSWVFTRLRVAGNSEKADFVTGTSAFPWSEDRLQQGVVYIVSPSPWTAVPGRLCNTKSTPLPGCTLGIAP